MALTCVTSLECIHSLSSQAMVSGGEDYPSSLHQKKKTPYLPYFPLYFFAFVLNLRYCSECVSSTLSCSITVGMNFFSLCWNSIKQNINGTKLIELDDFKANAVTFKYPSLPSCYWSGCRNSLHATVRCCKDHCPVLSTAAEQCWHGVKGSPLRGKCSSLCSVMADECDTLSHSNLCSQLTPLSFILITCNFFTVTFWGVVCVVKL